MQLLHFVSIIKYKFTEFSDFENESLLLESKIYLLFILYPFSISPEHFISDLKQR